MTRRGKLLTALFLTATALPLLMELRHAFDRDGDTWPWTDLIVAYVPWEAALAMYAALAVWLPAHFYVRYRRRNRKG